MNRIEREKKTVSAMIAIYCRAHHAGRWDEGGLCESCRELQSYAFDRLDRCPFGQEKSTCADCEVHCYRPTMRERAKQVMRYAGPRMLGRHPWLAIRHLIDGWRK